MNYKGRRVTAHNTWPASTEFQAEVEFKEKLISSSEAAPLNPIQLADNSDSAYQKCVGHLIDGLDALPQRPDYFFDHCFRVLDVSKKLIAAPDKGLAGAAANLPGKLITLDQTSWTEIADKLGAAIPNVTADLLAKRLLSSYEATGDELKQLRKRAEEILGKAFYEAFCKKYLLDDNGNQLPSFSQNLPAAGSLMRLYLSGKPGTRKEKASHPALDLRLKPASAAKRLQVLLSLLLFTVRNERAHGAVMSPFRSSKANLQRYQSYYYLMLAAYVFALGSLAFRFPNQSVKSSDILLSLRSNIALQARLFATTAPMSSNPIVAKSTPAAATTRPNSHA